MTERSMFSHGDKELLYYATIKTSLIGSDVELDVAADIIYVGLVVLQQLDLVLVL